MSTPNQHTAKSEEIQTKTSDSNKVNNSGTAGRLLGRFQSLRSAAARNLEEGLSATRGFLAEKGIGTEDLEDAISMITGPKNFSKSDRKEIRRKNEIKALCKGFSFGSYTTVSKIHIDNLPLRHNALCDQCSISTRTGVDEGTTGSRGTVRVLSDKLSVEAVISAYRSGNISLDEYVKEVSTLFKVDRFCTPHRKLRTLGLKTCPKGNLFKASTMRSQTYRSGVLNAHNVYGGQFERLSRTLFSMDKNSDPKAFYPLLGLLCYLPIPHNKAIECIMHWLGVVCQLTGHQILASASATRQIRRAVAVDSHFCSDVFDHLISLKESYILISVKPDAPELQYVKFTVLDWETYTKMFNDTYKPTLADDDFVPVVEEVVFDVEEFPTLSATIEMERALKERVLIKKEKNRESMIIKPVENRMLAGKHKYYGKIPITIADSLSAKNPQTKTFVVGKPGKWDLKSNAPGLEEVLAFTGRADLAENKNKKAHFIKSLLINAAKDDDYVKKVNEVNKAKSTPTFSVSNIFSALKPEIVVSGGGNGPNRIPSKMRIKHTTVKKISGRMIPSTANQDFVNCGNWIKVNTPRDGNCFFWCLHYHGFGFTRHEWRALFAKHEIEHEIPEVEFNDTVWASMMDWYTAINAYFKAIKNGFTLNTILYSPAGGIMHYAGDYRRAQTINIIYDMDARNHYDFIYNTNTWTLELGSLPTEAAETFFAMSGIKHADVFNDRCEDMRYLRDVNEALEKELPGCVLKWQVGMRNKAVTFTFTENHDENIQFVEAWNKVRGEIPAGKEKMIPAQIRKPVGKALEALGIDEGLCLGGVAERKRKEKELDRMINAPSEDDEEECEDCEIVLESVPLEESIVKHIPTAVLESPEYSAPVFTPVETYTSSVFKNIYDMDTKRTMLSKVISGEKYYAPLYNSGPDHTAAIDFLNVLYKKKIKKTAGITYGMLLDFFEPSFTDDHADTIQTGYLFQALSQGIQVPSANRLYASYADIQGFTFSGSELRYDESVTPFDSDEPGCWVDDAKTHSEWLIWQKARYSSACNYINVLTSTMAKFFDGFTFLGDIFSSMLDLFEEECLDKFRIIMPSNASVTAEVMTMIRAITTKRDQRSLRDLMTRIKRNPLIADMEITYYEIYDNLEYAQLVADYINYLNNPNGQVPTLASVQWDTHRGIIDIIHHYVGHMSNRLVIASLTGFMNFVHKFVFPVLVEKQVTKKFSLCALAEFLSAPHIRNALKGTKNHSDLQMKLTNFSNNFGAINYSAVVDNFGSDIAGGTLYCSAVFLKHLDYINFTFEKAVTANWTEGFRSLKGGGYGSMSRRMGFGVYCGDLHANHIIFRTDSLEKIWAKELEDPHNLRTPVLVELPYSLGLHYPQMDNSPDNLALGCTNRVLRYQKEYSAAMLMFIRKHIDYRFDNLILHPLDPGCVMDLEEYLEGTSYTIAQKNDIRSAWTRFCEECKLEVNCNVFVKDESYDLFKAPRQIFSTTNMMKAIVGPIIRSMEKHWFKQIDYHVKGLTDKERLERIKLLKFLAGMNIPLSMDFSAMEKHVTPMMHQAQNYFMYRMFSNNLHIGHLIEIAMSSCDERQGYTKDKAHIIEVFAKMASGDSKTATNNLMLNEFIQDALDFAFYCNQRMLSLVPLNKRTVVDFDAAFNKWKDLEWFEDWASIPGKMDGSKANHLILEGDDSLKIADPLMAKFAPRFFKDLGVDIKIVEFENLETASFCGIVASEDGTLVRDAVKTMVKMGSTNSRYLWCKDAKLAALHKLKAECMLHSYPNCPILSVYCRRIIYEVNRTYGQNEKMYKNEIMGMLKSEMSSWEWDRFKRSLEAADEEVQPISMNTRLVYEQCYNISPSAQMHLEHAIAVRPWPDVKVLLADFVPLEAKLYTSRYVLEEPLVRGCVAEVFVPETVRYILGQDSHYEIYRNFIATNHDASPEKCDYLW